MANFLPYPPFFYSSSSSLYSFFHWVLLQWNKQQWWGGGQYHKYRLGRGGFVFITRIIICRWWVFAWVVLILPTLILCKINSSVAIIDLSGNTSYSSIDETNDFAVIIWNYVSSGVRWWWIWITGGNSNSPWGPIGLGVGILVILSSCPCDLFIRIEFFKVYTSSGDTSVYSVNVYTYDIF